MINLRYFFFIILIALLSSVSNADVDEALKLCRSNEFSLNEILTAEFEWPALSEAKHHGIALLVLDEIVKHDKGIPLGSIVPLDVYNKLSLLFYESGGYYNYVLWDALRSLIVARTSSSIFNDDTVTIGSSILSNVFLNDQIQVLDQKVFFGALDLDDLTYRVGKGTLSADDIFESLGTTSIDVRFDVATCSDCSSYQELLLKPALPVLFNYIFENDVMLAVFVPGTIEYLKRGGTRNDDDLKSARDFRAIMGSARSQYSYSPLRVRKIYADHVKYLSDNFAELQDYHKSKFVSRVYGENQPVM